MEINGKLIVIGLLANGLSSPQLPLSLSSLTFFQSFGTDEIGSRKFTATLSELDSGKVVAKAIGAIQAPMVAPIILPIKLANLQFTSWGTYTWSFEVEGQEPFLSEFKLLRPPTPQVRMMSQMPSF
jgi:hypothetical protein